MPKHYRSPSQTKNFFFYIEWAHSLLLLPSSKVFKRRTRPGGKCFLSLSILLHPFSMLLSRQYVSIVNLIWIWFILQRHLRQDSGIGRLRLRQILLLRSTEYVFKIHSKASCMPPLEFHGACPFYLVLLSRFNETQFKGKWGSHINVLVCLFLGKP